MINYNAALLHTISDLDFLSSKKGSKTPTIGVVGINTPWHFRYNVASASTNA